MHDSSTRVTANRTESRWASTCCMALAVVLTVPCLAWATTPVTSSQQEVIVQLDGSRSLADVSIDLAKAGFPSSSAVDGVPERYRLRKVAVTSADSATLAKIRAVPGIGTVRRVYPTSDGKPLIHTGQAVVKFKPGATGDYAQSLALKYGAAIERRIEWLPQAYILRVPDADDSDAMSVAQALSAEPLVAYSHPSFFLAGLAEPLAVQIEDTLFPFQWHLNNTGQWPGGRPGADINVLPAWEITQGAGAVAAVIDEGVQKDHEDLKDNYLTGWDFDDGDADPTPTWFTEGHGTCVAGLLAARANNIGVRGVAPLASLIGIRALGSTIVDMADAFIFAEANGAMVISNSWHLIQFWLPGVPPAPNTIIGDAIRQVARQGRGGRGSLVVFASGNSSILVAFDNSLAAMPNAMAVGATQRDDTLTCYSSFGAEQSVVAPGGGLDGPRSLGGGWPGCFQQDMATTDVDESLTFDPTLGFANAFGYNPAIKGFFMGEIVTDPEVPDFPDTAYTHQMNGTSSACPNVAGVAALVFSINNGLTAREVKNLIEHTARKISTPNEQYDPVTGHNVHFGHGRVDAYAAVLAAREGKSWPSPITNIQNVSSQALARLFWELPDWDEDETADEDVAGVLVVQGPAGQLKWAPTDGVEYVVGQNVAPGVVVVANDLITALDQTGLPAAAFEYAFFVRNQADFYSWGRTTRFTSTGAVSVPLASIQASPTTGGAPLKVHFAGGGVDEVGIAALSWNFGDGTTGTGPAVDHTYSSPGTYLATLTAMNTSGQTAQTSVTISVLPGKNTPPTATIRANPTEGQAPLPVLFEGSGADVDGQVVLYLWDFGDGSTATGKTIEHIYLQPGTYGVRLIVRDNAGGEGSAAVLVTVKSDSTAAADTVPDGIAAPQSLCGLGAPGAAVASLFGLVGFAIIRRRTA